jgi:hypothetical protein
MSDFEKLLLQHLLVSLKTGISQFEIRLEKLLLQHLLVSLKREFRNSKSDLKAAALALVS